MSTVHLPLVPPDVDLRGFEWMPLDTKRLLDSDLFHASSGEEFKAAVALWCRAWQQVPASSLPNDDKRLAMMLGMTVAKFRKVREIALRGFVLCTDDRLYHPVIAAKALEAWEFREKQRRRAEARWGGSTAGTPAGNAAAHPNKTGPDKTGQDLPTPLPPFQLPAWVPTEPWVEYCEWRARIRKPLTPYAKKLAVKDLDRLRAAGHDPATVLDQSIKRGWLGLFGVKEDGAARENRGRQAEVERRNSDAVERFVNGGKS